MSRSGVAINTKIQQGGPGNHSQKLLLLISIEKMKMVLIDVILLPVKRFLIGRLPTLDTQFTIPRPVTSATITFHGLCAFNSIAFFGRRQRTLVQHKMDMKESIVVFKVGN
jgi:hypothetical protein